MENNSSQEIVKLLKSMSLRAFVKYFKEFQNKVDDDVLIKLFEENEQWSKQSYKTIISCGRKIFNDDLETLALILVVNSKNISDEIKDKANNYLVMFEYEASKIEIMSEEEYYWIMKDINEENNIIFGR